MTTTDIRKKQLLFFDESCVIKQDQDLIDLIAANGYKKALGVGVVEYFSNYLNLVDHGKVDFCIYIQGGVTVFDFNQLVDHVNVIIKENMNPNGLVYLALNKYLVIPKCYDNNLSSDYDTAIEEFVTNRINGTIEKYFACGNDNGLKFNWAHPLTRFHIRVSQ